MQQSSIYSHENYILGVKEHHIRMKHEIVAALQGENIINTIKSLRFSWLGHMQR